MTDSIDAKVKFRRGDRVWFTKVVEEHIPCECTGTGLRSITARLSPEEIEYLTTNYVCAKCHGYRTRKQSRIEPVQATVVRIMVDIQDGYENISYGLSGHGSLCFSTDRLFRTKRSCAASIRKAGKR